MLNFDALELFGVEVMQMVSQLLFLLFSSQIYWTPSFNINYYLESLIY